MPGIHYAIFALIFPRFYSLNKLALVEESQSQLDSTENLVLYYGQTSIFDSIQSEDIKHV